MAAQIKIKGPVSAGPAKKKPPSGGVAGFGVTLFFVFMLTYFAIYLLMFCTVGTTIAGIVLLLLAITMTIGGYLAGA
jgi:hypothetical protein